MIRSLLAERFQLLVHRETRLLSGYGLVPDKSGVKMKRSDPDGPARTNSQRGAIEAQGCSMNHLALRLSETLHLPVADLTKIEGSFDLRLQWTPEDLQARPPSTGNNPAAPQTSALGPNLFEALQQQLGLKLEPRKIPTEVLVIDRADKPSAN